jgi:hypothetical protein
MDKLYGKITASLIEKSPALADELVERINENVHPPERVGLDDVHIRAMYIISDQVNSFGGRFPCDEHDHLMRLLVDSPVLVGHRKDSLPIARNFHAEPVMKDDSRWIKAYFYWLKKSDGSGNLAGNIDGGIYKECSISFIFGFPECSICGNDIRRCGHRPLAEYSTASGRRQAFFNYRRVEKVLETSLVYRGSVHDTSLTNELFFGGETAAGGKEKDESKMVPRKRIRDLNKLRGDKTYLVMPAYESLRVYIGRSADDLWLMAESGRRIDSPVVRECTDNAELPEGNFIFDARLIGYRGKERRPVAELIDYLEGRKSPVRRIELRIADVIELKGRSAAVSPSLERRWLLEDQLGEKKNLLIPAVSTAAAELPAAVKSVATRYGAEIVGDEITERFLFTNQNRLLCRVSGRTPAKGGYQYRLSFWQDTKDAMVPATVFSREIWEDGDTVELEGREIFHDGGAVRMVNPRIVDSHGPYACPDFIENAVAESPALSSKMKYEMIRADKDSFLLTFFLGEEKKYFRLYRFSFARMEKGRRFLADVADDNHSVGNAPVLRGTVEKADANGGRMDFRLSGALGGRFVIRKALINGRKRHLFYRLSANKNGKSHV